MTKQNKKSNARVVTFSRVVGMEIGGQGRKVRGRIKLWVRGSYPEKQATLEMWLDEEKGPQLQLKPLPADFKQERDLIAHGMEVVPVIEALTDTVLIYDDPDLQRAHVGPEPEIAPLSAFEQAASKLQIGGMTEKVALLGGATKSAAGQK